jgi:hypothetical protein
MKNRVHIFLVALFIFAFILRVFYLPQGALTFGYDQARDAFRSQQILEGDIKILGPPASAPGLYHGVFYYYFLAPAYLIGNGDPIVAAYWVAFINALAVFIIYFFTYSLTKKKLPSLIAATVFAFSFEASQYATWLSNPTLGVWTVPIIYLGLWLWVKPKETYSKWGPALTAIGLGLSIQSEIFLAYHIVPVLIWLWVARENIKRTQVAKSLAVLFAILSSMILVEFRFGFKSIEGISGLLGITSQDNILASRDVGDFIVLYINQLGRTFANNLFPLNAGYGGALGIGLLVFVINDRRKDKSKTVSWQLFLVTYLLAHLPTVSMGGVSTPFLTVGIGGAVCVLAGIVIWKLWESGLAKTLFVLILVANLIAIVTKNRNGQVIFAIQEDLLLSNEIQLVDYTYEKADGEPFSINSLTSPLWVNTVWSYLYNWYGEREYAYIPEWRGRDQVGRLGNNLLDAQEGTIKHFFIKEPPRGIPGRYLESEQGAEDNRSVLLEEKSFGDLKVQYREIEEK